MSFIFLMEKDAAQGLLKKVAVYKIEFILMFALIFLS